LVNREIVIVGASSELAKSFIKLLQKNSFKVLLISRKSSKERLSSNTDEIVVKDYLQEFSKIKKEINKLDNPIIIYFNGVLFENRPIQVPTQAEIELTKKINFEIPFNLSRKLNKEINNVHRHVFISSMAAVRDRKKNYIYGRSKRKLEDSIKNSNLIPHLILRFGKIETKMSYGHKNPPFTLTTEMAAKLIFKNLKKEGIVYPLFGLRIISVILKILPKKVLTLLEI